MRTPDFRLISYPKLDRYREKVYTSGIDNCVAARYAGQIDICWFNDALFALAGLDYLLCKTVQS